jgi:methionine-rich copper-binding protein CopC
MQIDARIQTVSMGGLVALTLLGATAAPTPPTADASLSLPHITLEASIPEDDASVAGEVTEVRLFFSDAPLMRGASIRIVSSARTLMRSGPPAPDAVDPKQLSVQVAPALPPGSYVVQWRCIADDGHVMRGDFRFEVTG